MLHHDANGQHQIEAALGETLADVACRYVTAETNATLHNQIEKDMRS